MAEYVFKGLYELGWLGNANLASAVFAPIAMAFAVMSVSKKYLHKKVGEEQLAAKGNKQEE